MGGKNQNNHSSGCALPRPEWLDDEEEIVVILNSFLDKLDKKPADDRVRMPSIKITRKNCPRLYRHNELSDRTWLLLQGLKGQILDIRLNPKRMAYDAEYVGASLRMLPEGEAICRAWFSRPVHKSYQEEWVISISNYSDSFTDHGDSLRTRPVKIPGKSAEEVVNAFVKIGEYSHSRLTLRQLSARCFWGHSKVLDHRTDILCNLYPGLDVAPRPVLVHIRLPDQISGVLFIENQDTYVQALAGIPTEVTDLALVYSGGFRGSAERIRTSEGVSLHYHSSGCEISKPQFEAWWYGEKGFMWPVWFWGDLDYSGMAILKTLRQRFHEMSAWPIGYDKLIIALQNGLGHEPDLADKKEQKDLGNTGCYYADDRLLPMIRSLGKFVDQEIV